MGPFADFAQRKVMFAQLRAAAYVRYDDLPLRTMAGTRIAVEFVSNSYDCEGIQVIQCNIRNITARKHAEEQLRKLALAVEQSPESILITNLYAEIESVNEAFVPNTGYYCRDEVISRNPKLLHSGKTPPAMYASLWADREG